MKKAVLIVIFFWLFAGITHAQERTSYTPEERAKVQTAWMKENLQLTDDQLKLVDPLNLEYAKKMESVKGIDGKMKQLKKAKGILDEKDARLKKILTKKQFDTYLEKKKELREKAMEARK
jgi:hypothetical protein